jgi:hypothetical protein
MPATGIGGDSCRITVPLPKAWFLRTQPNGVPCGHRVWEPALQVPLLAISKLTSAARLKVPMGQVGGGNTVEGRFPNLICHRTSHGPFNFH